MKKATLLITLLFILTACQSRLTPAPVEVLPPPSRTPSPMGTPTPDATQVYQTTLSAKNTQIAANAATREARVTSTLTSPQRTPHSTPLLAPSSNAPTPTITPTPTPFITLDAPHGSPENYVLTQPAPITLIGLSLMESLPEYETAVWNQRNDDYGWHEGFSDALQFEWRRTFPQHLDQVEELSTINQEDDTPYGLYLNWKILVDILSEYYFQYFNKNQIAFVDQGWVNEENVNWTAYLVETDHDEAPEWLVQVTTTHDLYASFWLTLDQNADGTYTRIPNGIYSKTGFFNTETYVESIADFTGDGLSDVIFMDYMSGFGFQYSITYFSIAISTPDGFQIISDLREYEDSLSAIITLEYELVTSKTNNLPAFHITNVHELPWGCQYETYKDYQWLGGNETVTYSNSPEADTVACYLARAVDYRNPPENREAIRWLNYAYSEGEFSPEDQTFILYKLALLYALEGEPAAAKNYLNAIVELAENNAHPTTVALAQQLQPLLEQNQILPYKLCLAAEAIALPNPFSSGYIYVPTAYPYVGLEDGYPAPLCDTQDIQLEVLNTLQFNPTTSPENVLREAGFSVITIDQVPSNSLGNVWLALIEDDSPDNWGGDDWNTNHFVYLLRYTDLKGWDILTHFDYPDYLDWVNQDFTGDGIPEFGIVYKYDNPKYTPCDLGEEQYIVYIVSRLVENWNVLSSDNQICLPMSIPFVFEDVLQDKNGDGMVDRVVSQLEADNYDVSLLETIPPTRTLAVHITSYESDLRPLISKTALLSDLTSRFIESPTPSLLRPALETYRTRWGTGDDPTSQQIYAHLTYLVALTYELDGDETQAVELFYDIWANHPDTLWAYLAAARLELK